MFASAVVVMLAVGVGANTVTFGFVDALFLRPPAGVRDPDALVRLFIVRDDGMIRTPTGGGGSHPDFQILRAGVPGLPDIAAFLNPVMMDLGRGEGARQARGQAVSDGFFSVLGTRMAAGRSFVASEDRATGSDPVMVLSHAFWQRELGGDPGMIGRPVTVNGRSVIVVGVAEEHFTGIGLDEVDLWVPFAMAAPLGIMDNEGGDWRENPFMAAVRFVGRRGAGIAPGQVEEQATAALTRAALSDLDPTPSVVTGSRLAARSPARSATARLALWLLGMSTLILLMIGANLVNLFVARSTDRRREMASRMALGASPGRLLRQVLTDSMVLSFLGLVGGVILLFLGLRAGTLLGMPAQSGELHVSLLIVASFISLVAGTIPALVSAIGVSRSQPARLIAEGRSGAPPGRTRLQNGLVMLQMALSVVLFIGAALFVRSMRQVAGVTPGVETARISVATIALVRAGYAPAVRGAIYQSAIERLEQLPDVERAALARYAPLDGLRYSTEVLLSGDAEPIAENPFVSWVGGGYFETVGTRILQGRGIQASDRPGSEMVAVVSKSFADARASRGSLLGRCLLIPTQDEAGPCVRVVGISENQRSTFLDDEAAPVVYLSLHQHGDAVSTVDPFVLVRTRPGASVPADGVRGAFRQSRADLPFITVESLESRIRPDLLHLRLGLALFSVFGVIAMIVSALGVFGVINYYVTRRSAELAIRQSLGATSSEIVWFILRRSMGPAVAGIGTGLVAAFLGGRFIEAQLYGVAGRDLPSFVFAAILLGAMALLASLLPAWRGARTEPMVALRAD